MDVAVIGAGVVGLHVAVALAETGREVVVVSEHASRDTVSEVAGGLWSPFHAGPPEDVARWARTAYDEYARLARETPEACVRMLDARVVVPDDDVAEWWEACAPPGAGRPARPEERPPGAAAARVVTTPLVATARHLDWLAARFERAGGARTERRLATVDDAFALAPVVVACPGFAARELLGDPGLEAIRGVVVEVAYAGSAALVPLLDDTGEHPSYVLPRDDGTVLLGGRLDVGDERRTATPEEVADVIARATALAPELAGAAPLRTKVGLRPGRPEVRVEELPSTHGRLVVNYGHGGSGWTLAAGCAQDVLALLDRRAPVIQASVS